MPCFAMPCFAMPCLAMPCLANGERLARPRGRSQYSNAHRTEFQRVDSQESHRSPDAPAHSSFAPAISSSAFANPASESCGVGSHT